MRIRKRKVPLPFHLLSPVPIPPSFFSSDPDPTTTTTPPSLQVQLRHDASGTGPPIPTSDDNKAGPPAAVVSGGGPNWKDSNVGARSNGIASAHPATWWEDGKEEFGIDRSINANNVAAAARKGSSSTDPETLGQQQPQSAGSASHLPPPVVGAMSTWCKEYHHQDIKNDDDDHTSKSSSLFPSRKRGSCSSNSPSSSTSNVQQEIRPEGGNKLAGGGGVNSSDHKKKRSAGGVVMEGSRCSRVNGRGWRCSQPTLVGYSLCEHHLGKGRMRSMTASNLRPPRHLGTTASTTTTITAATPCSIAPKKPITDPLYGEPDTTRTKLVGALVVLPSSSNYGEDKEEEEEKQPQPQFMFPTNKKKSKLGTVKARSISSLLDQPEISNAAVALLADNHHPKY